MEVREKLDGREMCGASRHLTRFEEDILIYIDIVMVLMEL